MSEDKTPWGKHFESEPPQVTAGEMIRLADLIIERRRSETAASVLLAEYVLALASGSTHDTKARERLSAAMPDNEEPERCTNCGGAHHHREC